MNGLQWTEMQEEQRTRGVRPATVQDLFAAQRRSNQKGERSLMDSIMNLKKTLALGLLAAGLVAGIATVGYAQNTTTTPNGNIAPATADQRGLKPTCAGRLSGARTRCRSVLTAWSKGAMVGA